MRAVEFMVMGKPLGKQRPRVVHMGNTGKVRAFTPKETVNYENLVKWSYLQMCDNIKLEGEIRAEITAYFAVPKSDSKRKRALKLTGVIRHTSKPDTDNIAKIILDSLNGIAYDDDKQVCQLSVKKLYGVREGVVVRLEEIEGETDDC